MSYSMRYTGFLYSIFYSRHNFLIYHIIFVLYKTQCKNPNPNSYSFHCYHLLKFYIFTVITNPATIIIPIFIKICSLRLSSYMDLRVFNVNTVQFSYWLLFNNHTLCPLFTLPKTDVSMSIYTFIFYLFQINMSNFSTRALISVDHKVLNQFSQPIFPYFSHWNSPWHTSVYEFLRGINTY